MNTSVLTVTLNPALDKTVTVEQFEFGGLNRIKEWRTDPGGKGINVAKVLRTFTDKVSCTGFTAGRQGRAVNDKLADLGIPTLFVQVEGETRTNLKMYDEHTMITTELNEPGFVVTDQALSEFIACFQKAIKETDIVVLGGSLPPGAPSDMYRTLVDIANRAGVRTVLDADGEAFVQGLEAVPYAIKPNIHELEALFGETFTTDEEIIAAARRLTARGITYAAVSLGGDGSILVSETEAVRAKPFPITPMSTVGAGDSMVAALVYCILHGKPMEETARWTSAAGTITASKPGTQVCTREEVEARLPDVTTWKV